MRDMVARLSERERAILKDPNFISEDEADVIISMRRSSEKPIPLEKV